MVNSTGWLTRQGPARRPHPACLDGEGVRRGGTGTRPELLHHRDKPDGVGAVQRQIWLSIVFTTEASPVGSEGPNFFVLHPIGLVSDSLSDFHSSTPPWILSGLIVPPVGLLLGGVL